MIFEDLTEPGSEKLDGGEVSLALKGILASRPFRNSNQCSGLLRYIVEHSLTGKENLLRERVIGAELFGRPADYETSEDPVVRLRVSEVRKRLAQYYLSHRDRHNVQIDIPPGSYRATFHRNAEAAAGDVGGELDGMAAAFSAADVAGPRRDRVVGLKDIDAESGNELRAEGQFSSRWQRAAIVGIALMILGVIGGVATVHALSSGRAFRAFWAPWMNSSKPVIISIGSNAVYRLQYEYVGRYSKEHGLESQGQEFFIPFKKDESLQANEFFPARNSYVALGDVSAVSNIVATLTREKKPYQERFPDDISFAELRSTPAVLVGGFNNSMTIELGKHLEFVMRAGNEIDDTLNPHRKWLLNVSEDAHETADYAIITRIVKRDGDSPVMSVAGLGEYGTYAAAELVCSPTNIHLVTDRLPKDWPTKNLQVVLRIRVTDFKPTVSEVVAARSW